MTAQQEQNGRWTVESAVNYLLRNGATASRHAMGYPMLQLPKGKGLTFLGAIDFLKQKYGVKVIVIDRTRYLSSLGRLLPYLPVHP